MCLDLKNNKVKSQIATKDIVVYKRVKESVKFKKGNHGKDFIGKIRTLLAGEIECKGKISERGQRTFFCTNDVRLNGEYAEEKFGYNFSWVEDDAVISIIVDGKELERTSIYNTPYRNMPVEIGQTYESELIKVDDVIEAGLHSFESIEGSELSFGSTTIECIMPKGSEYYVGKFGSSVSYASNKLKYVKLIN